MTMPSPDTGTDPRFLGVLRSLATWVAVLAFGVMLGATLLGVAARYLGLRGVEWSFEVAAISFLWVSFFGVLLAELKRENVALTIFTDRLRGRAAGLMALLGALAVVLFSATLLKSGIAFADKSGMAPTPLLRVPRLVQIVPLIVFALGILAIAATRAFVILRRAARS